MKLDLRKHLPRLALTALAALLGSGVVLGIVQANVQEWAKSSGNDQYLVNYAGPAMTRLAETTSSMPFIFITTMILGGAIFLWADSFARRWLEWYAGHRGHAISVRSIDRKLASMTLFFFLVVAMILSGAWVLYERRNAPTDKQLVTSADTPKQPLSEEDRRFRYELRGFSLSTLNDVLQTSARTFGMLRSVDREKNGGTAELGVRERFIHRATSTMDFGMENIRKAVNKPNADEIDSEQVQGLIVNFFQEYVQLQQHIAQLNGLLGVDLPKTEEMQRWLESDRQCRTELQKLKAWPQAKKLREIQDSLFASVDRNFERPPIAITKQLPSNAQQQAELDNRTRERDLARIDAEEYKKQLEGVTHQLLTASRTLEAKERALQDALRSKEPGSKIVPQSSVSQPANPRTIQSLSQEERDSLSRDLYNMKSAIPVVYLTESGVEPSSHDRSVFVSIFKKAGIQPGTTGQELEGPDQTGLLLCVPDVKSIPEKVERLAEVLKKYGIETDYAPLVQSKISSTVPPEIGFVLFVGPK